MHYTFYYSTSARPIHHQLITYNLTFNLLYILQLENDRIALNTLLTGNRFLTTKSYNIAIEELDRHIRLHIAKFNSFKPILVTEKQIPKITTRKETLLTQINRKASKPKKKKDLKKFINQSKV
jgi:hypothetical protein